MIYNGLDGAISKFVRISAADSDGYVECISCGKKVHWTEAQCAHFIGRSHKSLRYCLENLAPACFHCNNVEPEKHLDTWAAKMSSEQLTRLSEMGRMMMKHTRNELRDMALFYRREFNRIKKQKHL